MTVFPFSSKSCFTLKAIFKLISASVKPFSTGAPCVWESDVLHLSQLFFYVLEVFLFPPSVLFLYLFRFIRTVPHTDIITTHNKNFNLFFLRIIIKTLHINLYEGFYCLLFFLINSLVWIWNRNCSFKCYITVTTLRIISYCSCICPCSSFSYIYSNIKVNWCLSICPTINAALICNIMVSIVSI